MVTIIPPLAIAYLVYEFAYPPWTAMRLAGLLLMTPALILLTVSRIQLGNSFSVSPQATQLVTRGIYSRIRNPIYVFGTLFLRDSFSFSNAPSCSCSSCPCSFSRSTAPAPKLASSKRISAMNTANTELAPGFDPLTGAHRSRQRFETSLDHLRRS
jgi:hypothetical protein